MKTGADGFRERRVDMKLQYLGHSCFRAESGNWAVILDPYRPGTVPGLGDLREEADLCLCSHEHGDHNGREGVKIREAKCGENGENPFVIEKLDSWHDDRKGELRGSNTIHILHAEGMKVVHLGDLGCMPGEEQLKLLEGADALLAPVGGYYTAPPELICSLTERIRPRVMIPMHYRTQGSGFDVLSTCEDYLKNCRDTVCYDGDTLELTAQTPPHTAVLIQKYYLGSKP